MLVVASVFSLPKKKSEIIGKRRKRN